MSLSQDSRSRGLRAEKWTSLTWDAHTFKSLLEGQSVRVQECEKSDSTGISKGGWAAQQDGTADESTVVTKQSLCSEMGLR